MVKLQGDFHFSFGTSTKQSEQPQGDIFTRIALQREPCTVKREKNANGVILITKDLVTQTQRNTVSGINLCVSIGCTVPSPLFVPVVLPLLYIRNNMQGGWNCENNNISVICDTYIP